MRNADRRIVARVSDRSGRSGPKAAGLTHARMHPALPMPAPEFRALQSEERSYLLEWQTRVLPRSASMRCKTWHPGHGLARSPTQLLVSTSFATSWHPGWSSATPVGGPCPAAMTVPSLSRSGRWLTRWRWSTNWEPGNGECSHWDPGWSNSVMCRAIRGPVRSGPARSGPGRRFHPAIEVDRVAMHQAIQRHARYTQFLRG